MQKIAILIGLSLLAGVSSVASTLQIIRGPLNSGKIYVPCVFDGVQRSCFLDTGGAFSALRFSSFSSRYSSIGKFQYTSASGAKAEADWITIGTLESCGVSLENAKIARFLKGAAGEDTIGIDLLSGTRVIFNFQARTMESDQKPPFGLPLHELQIHPKGIFSIPLSIGSNVPLRGFWDTGAGLSAIDQAIIAAHPELFDFIADIPQGTDATGAPVVLKLYQIKNLRIGEVNQSNSYVLALNFDHIRKYIGESVSFIIGFNIISQHNWYFDLQRKAWGISAFSIENR